MYKLTKTKLVDGTLIDGVKKVDGNITTYITFDPANTDYQAYLKWLEEGNTPEAADDQA